MKRTVRYAVPLCVLFALSSSSLWAQGTQTREGFWIGFGFGYGSLGLSCDGCDGDIAREGGVSAHIRLGGTLNSKLLLGFESNGWVTTVADASKTMISNNMSAAVYYYPFTSNGLFVKGGLGSSYYREDVLGVGASSTGFGIVTGLGYDFRVGRNVSITPVGTLRFGGGGDMDIPGFGPVSGLAHSVASLDLSFTLH